MSADFNGDGKSDILWQNDNGLPGIWTMDGSHITGTGLSQSWQRPAVGPGPCRFGDWRLTAAGLQRGPSAS